MPKYAGGERFKYPETEVLINKADIHNLWAKDMQADLFDVFVLNEKFALDELRAEQLNEIRETGRVYGKWYSD